ncbi:MAG: SPOR domain-containing protein [Candidimonas sp.]|nr:MAG: SPOR domain-containing protein [Candidimonas sp.]
MGLFSRNESSADSGTRRGSRSTAAGDAGASELRGRARRRLIGAIVLIVAAVVILPMLFSRPPSTEKTPTVAQVTIPAAPPINPVTPAPASPDANSAVSQEPLPAPPPIQPNDTGVQPAAPGPVNSLPPNQTGSAAQANNASPEPSAPEKKVVKKPAEKNHEPPAEPEHRAANDRGKETRPRVVDRGPGSTVDRVKRTDDGSVALALLQGRSPGQAAPGTNDRGRFVLQIAAYTVKADAESRRGRLAAAGVTNAYVESGVSSGKTTYRLRVGPFSTREAAQAAQARLRALGYDNGFISAK